MLTAVHARPEPSGIAALVLLPQIAASRAPSLAPLVSCTRLVTRIPTTMIPRRSRKPMGATKVNSATVTPAWPRRRRPSARKPPEDPASGRRYVLAGDTVTASLTEPSSEVLAASLVPGREGAFASLVILVPLIACGIAVP